MVGSDQLVEKLVQALHEVEAIQLRLHPPLLKEYQARLKSVATFAFLADELARAKIEGPMAPVVGHLLRAASQLQKGIELFCSAGSSQAELMKVFRSIRFFCRALEELYPLAAFYPAINRLFLEAEKENDAELQQLLQTKQNDDTGRGIIHYNNQRGQRGGYSLYVPEYYSPSQNWPLIVALHGGSGHGADFFFSWLASARSFGCILLAPSSKLTTWSLTRPEVDGAAIGHMIEHVAAEYNIERQKILYTGISDGGTFAMRAALLPGAAATHIAPVACAAHAFTETAAYYKDKKIYLVHGAKDWMFNVNGVRVSAIALKQAGAAVVYREIEDLSHNYARDENPAILRWFL